MIESAASNSPDPFTLVENDGEVNPEGHAKTKTREKWREEERERKTGKEGESESGREKEKNRVEERAEGTDNT